MVDSYTRSRSSQSIPNAADRMHRNTQSIKYTLILSSLHWFINVIFISINNSLIITRLLVWQFNFIKCFSMINFKWLLDLPSFPKLEESNFCFIVWKSLAHSGKRSGPKRDLRCDNAIPGNDALHFGIRSNAVNFGLLASSQSCAQSVYTSL